MRRKSGRIVMLLGLLLLLVLVVAGYFLLTSGDGATSIFGAASTATPLPVNQILVARRDIPENTFLTSAVIEESFEYITKTIDLHSGIISSKSQLLEKVNRQRLVAGEVLYTRQFAEASLSFKIDPGKRAFPIQVDRFSGVVGEITERDYVDVLLSGHFDEYFMQEFPLTVECILPEGCPSYTVLPFPQTGIEPLSLLSVKAVLELQRIEVLKVITLTTEALRQPGQPTPTPALMPSLPSAWILILAVDDQQAELLQFALDKGWKPQLLLRPQGDDTQTTTTGVTAWILLDTYGMPLPRAIPHPVDPGTLPQGVIPSQLP